MDIHVTNLERLVLHIEDDGAITPQKVAEVIKAKPENTTFLRGYVEAAAIQLSRPDVIAEFDAALASNTPPEAPAEAPKPAPPIEDEIRSTPEPQAPAAPAPALEQAPAKPVVGPPGPTISYKYRDANGIITPLRVVTAKATVVVLEDMPTDEFVGVVIKGERVDLNITKLRGMPAGDTMEINGAAYPVASLLVIATAAKP